MSTKYAYVTVLYGTNIYITGAIMLGYTLMKTNSQYDRVILVTNDVDQNYLKILSNFYTRIIPIEYVKVNPNIFLDQNTRFRDVFTKLICLNLIEYHKILLMDLDMIVVNNIDHLFQLSTPAACLKRDFVPYGKRIKSDKICKNGKLVGSINAGLVLLKPDKNEWSDIKKDIFSNKKLLKYKYPEQDYISLRYCHQWTSITFNYNFQFGLTNRVKKYRYKYDNIYVIHYSSSFKPWYRLISTYQPSLDEIKFIEQHQKYYDLWYNGYQSIIKKYGHIDLPFYF